MIILLILKQIKENTINCIVISLFNLYQFANITNGNGRKFSVVSILNNPPCNVY